MNYLTRAAIFWLFPTILLVASSTVLAQRTVTGDTPSGERLTLAVTENMT